MSITLTTVFTCVAVIGIWQVYEILNKWVVLSAREKSLSQTKFGLVPVTGLNPKPRHGGTDVIFVHGLGADPNTTWRCKRRASEGQKASADELAEAPEGICWVTDFLPEDLRSHNCGRTRLFFYNYNSFFKRDALQVRLHNLAANMLNSINAELRNTPRTKRQKLVFVGHSYGGLIIKEALVQARKHSAYAHIADATKGVIFLGTPHKGPTLSVRGRIAAGLGAFGLRPLGSNASILTDLIYDTAALEQLSESFAAMFGRTLDVTNIYETLETKFFAYKDGVPLFREVVVSAESATFSSSFKSTENISLDTDHSGLNKFASRDGSYHRIYKKLLSLLKPVPHNFIHLETTQVSSYTERQSLTTMIDEIFSGSEAAVHGVQSSSSTSVLLLHGMGGIGKTQLALKYAQANRERYDPILWIDCSSTAALERSFRCCAAKLGLESVTHRPVDLSQDSHLEDDLALQAVFEFLSEQDHSDPRWLMVFDNMDDTEQLVSRILAQLHSDRGHILITSRYLNILEVVSLQFYSRAVDVLQEDEACALLLGHAARCYNRCDESGQALDNVPVAYQSFLRVAEIRERTQQIVHDLGLLPLAVDLAGLWLSQELLHIGELDTSYNQVCAALQRYYGNLQRRRNTLLQNPPSHSLSQYTKTVWTVWDTTFDAISARHPHFHARELLCLMAHLDRACIQDEFFQVVACGLQVMDLHCNLSSEDIPLWLRDILACDNNTWLDHEYHETVKILILFGLIHPVHRDKSTERLSYSMHGLVRWRARMEATDFVWRRRMLIIGGTAARQMRRRRFQPRFQKHLRVHLDSILETDPVDDESADELLATAMSLIARVYFDECRSSRAQQIWLKAWKWRRSLLGDEHGSTLLTQSYLALSYKQLGDWNMAESMYLDILAARRRNSGTETHEYAGSLSSLAMCYANSGRLTDAEHLMIEATAIRIRLFGTQDRRTLSAKAQYASTLSIQGKHMEAGEMFWEVYDGRRKLFGDKHLATLAVAQEVADNSWARSKLDDVEGLLKNILSEYRQVYDDHHEDVRSVQYSLAGLYKEQGRHDEAVRLEAQVDAALREAVRDPELFREYSLWKKAAEKRLELNAAAGYFPRDTW